MSENYLIAGQALNGIH